MAHDFIPSLGDVITPRPQPYSNHSGPYIKPARLLALPSAIGRSEDQLP